MVPSDYQTAGAEPMLACQQLNPLLQSQFNVGKKKKKRKMSVTRLYVLNKIKGCLNMDGLLVH